MKIESLKSKAILYCSVLLLVMFMSVGQSMAQMPAPTKTPTSAPPGAVQSMQPMSGNYVWTTPIMGMPTIPVWTRGSTYNLTWTGGPTGPVKIYVVNWCTWTAVLQLATSAPNSHTFSWTVPTSLLCGVYECYIQNANGAATNWTYSQNFAITR